MSANSGGWRVTLHCNRAEAEAIPFADEVFADLDSPPTLLTDEPDPGRPDDWLLHAYFADQPEPEWLARLSAMAPGSIAAPQVERLPDTDWVTLSQAGLEPVRAGRYHVATREHAHRLRPGEIGLVIDAGLAFGTGQHATTAGCLSALDRLARSHRFENIVDLGTGTGVLAFAAALTWRRARVTASDIDPVAAVVARANARVNAVSLGVGTGRVDVFAAKGLNDRRLRQRAPYDLVIANILAQPLVELAGSIAGALKPGGFVVLAGLLDSQAAKVTGAYAARGLKRVATSGGEWPTLVLRS
ncbi:50S ribosomal protein L11 methyltransferase [Sphingosinicellaceae bacterium]|nr:50S ribosomal protein L11 methyltransferase [Sphingosinicellaceae bacterium]